jgi:hypothetical protein
VAGGRGAVAVVTALAALLLAGCSSGGSSGGANGGADGRFGEPTGAGVPTTFSAALAALPSTSWDGGYVEFGDVAHVNALSGPAGSGPLSEYYGIGESSLAGFAEQDLGALGFDPLKAAAAVTVGQLPNQVTVLYGSFDASAVDSKLSAAHFKNKGTAGGGTVWALGADNQQNLQNPTGNPLANDIDVTAARIAIGPSATDVDALAAPSGAMLSSNSAINALASCLDGASAGIISQPSSGTIGQPTSTPDSRPIGIGLVAPSAQSAGEEICASAADSATATAIGANFTKQIETGTSRRLNEPWSKVLVDPQASVVSSSPAVVRLTTRPGSGSHIGVLLESLFAAESDLSTLISP